MNPETIEKLYKLLDELPVTTANRAQIRHIKELLDNKDFDKAMSELQTLKYELYIDTSNELDNENKDDDNNLFKPQNTAPLKEENKDKDNSNKSSENTDENSFKDSYPKELMDEELEETYIGLLLTNPKSISKFFFLFEDCYFADDTILNLYKLVLFSDGEAYAPEEAKAHFNFARDIENIYPLKELYKAKVKGKVYDFEKIYVELRKLFVLRKNFTRISKTFKIKL